MIPPRRPLFLGRAPYRRRRLRDAARLLPLTAALLFLLPMLWTPEGEATGRHLSDDIAYFFLVWALLIGVAAAFAPGLAQSEEGQGEDRAEDDRSGWDEG